VQISARVAQNLNEIVETVRKVDDLISEVATASGEQDQGVDQINSAVSQMDKITQSNAAGAEESAAAAEELKAQSMALQDAVTGLSKMVGGEEEPAPNITERVEKNRVNFRRRTHTNRAAAQRKLRTLS
jgi:uncharacterized phage infection (PIP) family protein YhgE